MKKQYNAPTTEQIRVATEPVMGNLSLTINEEKQVNAQDIESRKHFNVWDDDEEEQ